MFKIVLVATALIVPLATAQAGTPCSKRTDVLAELSSKYKEMPVAIGLASNGNLLEVLTSTDGKTWTIIQTAPTGIACMIAAGEGWQPKEAQLASTDPQI